VYLMYHGTRPEVAALIEQGGFKASTQGLLGPGVYVGRTAEGCRKYGSTILEVMVRVGRVCRADEHPELMPRGYGTDAPWHDVGGYDTAWVPPDCAASVFDEAELFEGVEEQDCVWDAGCVKVLGRAADDGDERMQAIEWSFEHSSDGGRGDGEVAGAIGWVDFSRAEGLAIESHYRAWQSEGGKGTVGITVGGGARALFGRPTGNRLEVCFDRMVERSLRTGAESRIRRGLSGRGAAAILQAMVRREARRRSEVMITRSTAIVVLQRTYRGHLCRRSLR
jgi:hypothetical protein